MDSRPPSSRMSRPLPTPQRVPVPLASMDGVPPSASAYSQSYSRHQSYAQYPGTAYSGGGFPASEPQYEEEEEEMEIGSQTENYPTMDYAGDTYRHPVGPPLEGIDERGGNMGMQTPAGMRDLTGTGVPFGGMRLGDIQRDTFSPSPFMESKKKKKGSVGGFFKGLRRFPSKLVKKKKMPEPNGREIARLDDPDMDYMNSGMGTNTEMDRGGTVYDLQTPMMPGVGGFIPPPLTEQEEVTVPPQARRSPDGRGLFPPPVTVMDYDEPNGIATTIQRTPTHHSHHSGTSRRSHRSDDPAREGVRPESHGGASLARSRTRTTRSTSRSHDTARPLRGGKRKYDDDYKYRRPSTHETHSMSGRGSSSASASTSHGRRHSRTLTEESLPPTRLEHMRRAIRGFKRMPWVASTRITSDYRPAVSSSRARDHPALEAKRRQQGLPKKGESWYRPSAEQQRRMREKEEARREKRRRRRRAMGLDSRGSTTTDAMSHSHRSHSPRFQQPVLPYGFLAPPGLPSMAVPGSPPTPSLQNLLASPYAYNYGGQPLYVLPQSALQQMPPLPVQPVPSIPVPPQPTGNVATRVSRSISNATRNKIRPLSAFIPGSSTFGLRGNLQGPPAPPQLTNPQAVYLVPGSTLMGGMGQLPQYPGFVPQQVQPMPGMGAADLKRDPSSSRQGGNGGAPPP